MRMRKGMHYAIGFLIEQVGRTSLHSSGGEGVTQPVLGNFRNGIRGVWRLEFGL